MAPCAVTKQQPVHWLPATWTVGFMTLYLGITLFIADSVPESYMDEPFHVPMAQLYCKGDFFTWDPKITTFPGLYAIGAAYAWASQLLLNWTGVTLELTCSGPYLRSVNALLAVATLQLAYAISIELQQNRADSNSSSKQSPTQQQQQQQQSQGAAGIALVIGLLPTQLFFAFLFYTDVPSLLFLLITELLLLRHRPYAAAAAGAAAIGMRQTNAVWVTFLTGASILREVLPAAVQTNRGGSAGHETAAGSKQLKDKSAGNSAQQQQQGHAAGMLCEVQGIMSNLWRQKASLLQGYCLLLVLPVTFVVFVIWNGAITLGDKDAHAPTLHLMQPLYFALFCLASAAPIMIQPAVASRLQLALKAAPVLCTAVGAAAAAAAVLCVQNYSLTHPYLVADNRHYTFYLWRRIFGRHELIRLAAVPACVAGWVLLVAGLSATEHWLWLVGFMASCWVTLAPAWLIEFRYFTTAFVLAMLHMPVPPKQLSFLTAAGYCCVNALTLWVFAKRPYTWGDGSVARFMW